jgi:acyl-coenzyme A thioesterase PaaI-like protein
MNEARKTIPKLEGYNCFACGTANPIGLNLQFYVSGKHMCSDVTLRKDYEGWENMAHGGIVSTLLDEVMSWAVIYFKRIFFVTRSMKIKYLKPVPLETPFTVKASVLDEKRSRISHVRGLIHDQQDNTLVRGDATFARLSDMELYLVPERLKKDMEDLFERLRRHHERGANHLSI